jgi:Fe-S-cluster containining protein
VTGIEEAVQRKADAALRDHPWLNNPVLTQRVKQILGAGTTGAVKRRRIIQIIDSANHALAPHTACKTGCGHCCNIAVEITRREAEAIGAVAHISPMVLPGADRETSDRLHQGIALYRDVPCPFLLDQQCSVYEVRPSACRAHHSLNEDNEQCKMSTPSEASSVPSFNLKAPLYALAYLAVNAGESVGDIREYFPKGSDFVRSAQ